MIRHKFGGGAFRLRPNGGVSSHRLGRDALRLRMFEGAVGHKLGALGFRLFEGVLRHAQGGGVLIPRLCEGALRHTQGGGVLICRLCEGVLRHAQGGSVLILRLCEGALSHVQGGGVLILRLCEVALSHGFGEYLLRHFFDVRFGRGRVKVGVLGASGSAEMCCVFKLTLMESSFVFRLANRGLRVCVLCWVRVACFFGDDCLGDLDGLHNVAVETFFSLSMY